MEGMEKDSLNGQINKWKVSHPKVIFREAKQNGRKRIPIEAVAGHTPSAKLYSIANKFMLSH